MTAAHSTETDPLTTPLVHIIRHGQALHNVDRGYPHRDPPLTDAGHEATRHIEIPASPDLIIISPMTRTIQTAMNAFPSIFDSSTPSFSVEVMIWPDLRETHDANCNKGLSRTEISAKFPRLDFAACPEEWDHPPHTVEGAVARAEVVRGRLKELSRVYRNIVLITHRGFIAFLVQEGDHFDKGDRTLVRQFLCRTSLREGIDGKDEVFGDISEGEGKLLDMESRKVQKHAVQS